MDRINNFRPTYPPTDDARWSEDEYLSGRTEDRDFRWAQVDYQSGGNFRAPYSLASQGRRLSTLPQGVQQRSSGSYDSGYGRAFYEIPRREDYSSTSNAYPSLLVNRHLPHHAEEPFRDEGESRQASSRSTQILHDAGFGSVDRHDVRALDSSRRRFVALNAMRFRSYGYVPQEIISAAKLSRDARSFLSSNAETLHAQHFLPSESNALAELRSYNQNFVMQEHSALQSMGFSPLNMIAMACRSPIERAYVLVHGVSLYERGYTPREIMDEALLSRTRSASPYRAETRSPRRAGPSESPTPGWRTPTFGANADSYVPLARAGSFRHDQAWSSSPDRMTASSPLSDAEVASLTALGFEPELLVELAQRPDAERSFVLSQGDYLMDAGLSYNQILQLAREADNTFPVPRTPPYRAASPIAGPSTWAHRSGEADFYSGLTDEEIAASFQGLSVRDTPANTSAAEPTHARNNAQFGRQESDMLNHAYRRWFGGSLTLEMGAEFYRRTVPQALSQGMARPDGQPNLLILLSGQAYAEDNRSPRTSARHEARVKAVAGYLVNAGDTELLRECDSAAERAVANCEDMVLYGLTQVEQVIQQHKIDHNLLTPRQMFSSIERSFLQLRTEGLAAEMANGRFSALNRGANNRNQATESVELYLALSEKLLANGWNLTESAQSSSYGGIHRVTAEDVRAVESELNRHVRDLSDDYLQEFEGKPAVEQALRQLFGEDYVRMSEDREAISDQANDALFDSDLPEGAQISARAVLESLAGVEKDWYRDKLKVVLRNTDMLSQLEAAV